MRFLLYSLFPFFFTIFVSRLSDFSSILDVIHRIITRQCVYYVREKFSHEILNNKTPDVNYELARVIKKKWGLGVFRATITREIDVVLKFSGLRVYSNDRKFRNF